MRTSGRMDRRQTVHCFPEPRLHREDTAAQDLTDSRNVHQGRLLWGLWSRVPSAPGRHKGSSTSRVQLQVGVWPEGSLPSLLGPQPRVCSVGTQAWLSRPSLGVGVGDSRAGFPPMFPSLRLSPGQQPVPASERSSSVLHCCFCLRCQACLPPHPGASCITSMARKRSPCSCLLTAFLLFFCL